MGLFRVHLVWCSISVFSGRTQIRPVTNWKPKQFKRFSQWADFRSIGLFSGRHLAARYPFSLGWNHLPHIPPCRQMANHCWHCAIPCGNPMVFRLYLEWFRAFHCFVYWHWILADVCCAFHLYGYFHSKTTGKMNSFCAPIRHLNRSENLCRVVSKDLNKLAHRSNAFTQFKYSRFCLTTTHNP